jgi:outer membrane protein assembly factor BamB
VELGLFDVSSEIPSNAQLTMHFPLLAAAALAIGPALAVFKDEAWNTDYQFALLGQPKEDTTFFHQPDASSRASLVYTLSEEAVVGAVNPRDGALVWRQRLQSNATTAVPAFLRAGEGQDVVVGGIGAHITAWSAGDGRLAWSRKVPDQIADLEILELVDGTTTIGVKDVLVLTSGAHPTIQRLDGATGSIKWSQSLESGDTPYQVSASSTEVFAILLHKTMLGYLKIKVISLDPVTGRKNDEHTLNSENELASPDTIVAVGANSASPIIAWTDPAHTVLKVNIVGSKTVASFNIEKRSGETVRRARLHAPFHANALAHFLVHFETETSHWAEVFHIDMEKNSIEKAYSLPKVAGKGAFSTSTANANVFFTRITRDQVMTVSSVSHGILGKWPISEFGVVAGINEIVEPIHAVSEVSVKGSGMSALRSAILLSTGDWVLLRDGSPVWLRPETLAGTTTATFANPAAVEAFAQQLEIEAHSNFVSAYFHRVARHLADLQKLPEVMAALPQRIQRGLFGTTADSGRTKDVFGFHKVVAMASKNGRVIALDAGNPKSVLWSRKVVDVKPGQAWTPSFTSAEDGILTLTHGESGGSIQLNATTGADVSVVQRPKIDLQQPGAVSFTMRNGELEATKPGTSAALWRFIPPKEERVVSLVPRPVNDPVASIGKVLGDRRVLYKYLSPNLALLVTANDAFKSASFYVLDTVSGATLYSNVHTDVDLSAPIPSIMSENWFAYSYTAEISETTPKGHHLVVGEMFESLIPNDRGPLSAKTNVSSFQAAAEPFVLSRSYQIPEAIAKLSVTETRQGITSRQLLAVMDDSNSIVGIPYSVLDPRRPIGKDPTKDEQMEGLMRYNPTLEFDPKWYLNHQRELLGITNVITSPALIESTSLVFAYGLDIFGTRLSPSFSFDILGKDFNKFQMLATVAALGVGTVVVAPLVSAMFDDLVRLC